ncbi:MAG: transcriptional coactivator p15/PC4 family protein [Candidatus Brocadiales bacterium]|nr:transcriptional coactivator p15/PC4 family protein [Candidatus Bathyanammoxibius sp.]
MEKLVDRFDKNAVEEVRVSLDEYRGHQLFSLRVWTENKAGERVPTKKGLTLKTDLFPKFKRAVEKLEAAILEAGLLDPEDIEVG